jgi:Aldo/keto reductase family
VIVPRLILGTARIAGGADEYRAVDLIRCALDAGVTAVDTAPSYGMGTAEAAVGKAIRGYSKISVATKLGSSPPTFPWLRTALRRAKRSLGSGEIASPGFAAPTISGPTGNQFNPAAMTASLDRSRDRLGPIDVLLLHDISTGEVTNAVLASLAKLCAAAGARQGYAIHAQWDAGFDRAFPAGNIAQCAPNPEWLRGRYLSPRQCELRLHSLGKTGLALRASDPQFAAALQKAAAIAGAPDRQTSELAAIYALACERFPEARLLITSSHRSRLGDLLAALAKIDKAGSAPEIASLFPAQAG